MRALRAGTLGRASRQHVKRCFASMQNKPQSCANLRCEFEDFRHCVPSSLPESRVGPVVSAMGVKAGAGRRLTGQKHAMSSLWVQHQPRMLAKRFQALSHCLGERIGGPQRVAAARDQHNPCLGDLNWNGRRRYLGCKAKQALFVIASIGDQAVNVFPFPVGIIGDERQRNTLVCPRRSLRPNFAISPRPNVPPDHGSGTDRHHDVDASVTNCRQQSGLCSF